MKAAIAIASKIHILNRFDFERIFAPVTVQKNNVSSL